MNTREMIEDLRIESALPKTETTQEEKYLFAVRQKAEHWRSEMEKNIKHMYQFREYEKFKAFVKDGLVGRYVLNSSILKGAQAEKIDNFLVDILKAFDEIQEKTEGFKFTISPISSVYLANGDDGNEFYVDVLSKLVLAPKPPIKNISKKKTPLPLEVSKTKSKPKGKVEVKKKKTTSSKKKLKK